MGDDMYNDRKKVQQPVAEAEHAEWVDRLMDQLIPDPYAPMTEVEQALIQTKHSRDTQRERRRYALLQAAATICAQTIKELPNGQKHADMMGMFVGVAEELLEEIERREAK